MDEMVAIKDKVLLAIKEAAAYSYIGINKLDSLLRAPDCPFVLFVGSKKLVDEKSLKSFCQKL